MAGVATDPTMIQCPRQSWPTNHFIPLCSFDWHTTPSFIWTCHCLHRIFSIMNSSETTARCACKQVCTAMCAGMHSCMCILECAYSGNSVLTSCCHKQALCSLWKSPTSGQINYQVICHYLLSPGRGRSRPTGHASLCLCVWSEMETEKHSRTFAYLL